MRGTLSHRLPNLALLLLLAMAGCDDKEPSLFFSAPNVEQARRLTIQYRQGERTRTVRGDEFELRAGSTEARTRSWSVPAPLTLTIEVVAMQNGDTVAVGRIDHDPFRDTRYQIHLEQSNFGPLVTGCPVCTTYRFDVRPAFRTHPNDAFWIQVQPHSAPDGLVH